MKRCIDILLSLTLLILFSPIFIVVSVVIRVALGSPVLFKQQRPGLHGRPFHLYKFRTMNQKTNEHGELLADEQRLTATGQLIRKFSLDEIPQLINVLKGEMSIVGPRPLLMEYLPLYTKEQAMRHQVKPGITGWAQVNGRNTLSWEEKFKLDTWYVRNHTFLLDVKIILLTVRKVVKREGIHYDGHVSMEKFKGSEDVM